METVCDHARALGADATTKFSIALRYHESSDVEPSTSTFGDLSRVAENAAARLRESVEWDAGDAMRPMCCGIMVEDGMDLFQCQLAVMFAGLAVLPLSPRDPPRRLASVLEDADARVVVVRNEDDEKLLRQVRDDDVSVWKISDLLSAETSSGTGDVHVPKPSDASHVFFTSGSTGRPKGCIASHGALLAYCHAKNAMHEIGERSGDVVFCASNHMFDPHLTDFFSALVGGATLASASRTFMLTDLGGALRASEATHCLTTPVMLSSIDDVDAFASSPLRMVALGGEATPAALARRWLDAGVRVANTYGVTECVAYQSFREITDPSTQDVRALGDPLPGVTFAFAAEPGDDPTASAKAGELAELWIGGKQLGMGYLNRPELTVERFQRGLYRTGDIVRVGPDGQCVLLGRRDDQVKINGQRVELGEIEDAMRRTCGSVVSEVKCVITREKQLVGYYTSTAAKTSEMMTEVMRYILGLEVPRHMVPSAFVRLNAFPVTATGKICRSTLLKRAIEFDAPYNASIKRGPFGSDMAEIWSQELGMDVKFGDCDFIAMGGNSLTALRVVQRVKRLFSSGSNCDEDGGGTFGEALGVFAPIELLNRPVFNDYARFVRVNVEDWPTKYETDSEEEEQDDVGGGDTNLPLRVAAAGDTDLIRLLARTGISVDPKSDLTPLHVACANSRVECARALIELGAHVNAKGTNQRTPLLFAVSSPTCTAEMVRTLVESGASLVAVDSDRQTCLHVAARAGASSSVMDVLTTHDTAQTTTKTTKTSKSKSPMKNAMLDVDARDAWGRTALHWASVNGHRNACKRLLELDVDASIKDSNGETARDIAERRALCSAAERPKGGRPSTWGDIASLLGGSGATKHLKNAFG